MIKYNNDIPNRIKQPSECCIYCGKSYIKKQNLNKHLIICDLLNNKRKRSQIFSEDEDDDEEIPSRKKMFEILIELGQKYSKLEEKVEELHKWVVKKKKKINVVEWLNMNIKPNINFDNIIDKIIINEQDIMNLLDNSFYDILNEVFSRNIYNFNEIENPIIAFTEKKNAFYIYDKDNIWIELSKEKISKFLNKVHTKILNKFFDWKALKKYDNKLDDKFAIKCDKALIKITSIELNEESILSKIKNNMFLKMKTDLKALIEYELEF